MRVLTRRYRVELEPARLLLPALRRCAVGRPGGEGERISSPALAPPLDRHDGSSPRSTTAAPDPRFEIEHLGLPAEPKPQQKILPQQRDVMAGSAIDLHEVAQPEILDPRRYSR